MPIKNGRTHTFNAEAHVLKGDLTLPLVQRIHPQAHNLLPAEGGYKAQHSNAFRVENVLTYGVGHSQSAGHEAIKEGPNNGWSTITTTVIEDLNVLEILTCDRIVGQVITEHPAEGYVPTISFLGTRYENLRIGGYRVELEMDLNVLGDKPAKDGPYSKQDDVIKNVKEQYDHFHKNKNLPAHLKDKYNQLTSHLGKSEELKCSVVKEASGLYPGHSYGNVIIVPHFGTITLGAVRVFEEDFTPTGTPKKTTVYLTMLDLNLGCAIHGNATAGCIMQNGDSAP